jgi:hypothetical protein
MPFNQGGPVTDYKTDVGPGWHGLLDRLHAELAAVDPDYQTVQVKEKFGCLRVYLRNTPDALRDILDRFEALSAGVCENCGKPGACKPGTPHGWIKTLCDECRRTE